MVLLAEGAPVVVECPQETGFKLAPDRLSGDHAENEMDHSQQPVEPVRGRYTYDELKALTDVLQHEHVWLMPDEHEHLVYDDFEFFTPAQVEPKLPTAP